MDTPPVALVVDDDRAVCLLARTLLEDTGFTVEQASDGIEALEAFERLKPSIVLLDVIMPNMDGFTVCEKIRGAASGEHVPILMMTGLDDIESINRGYQAGATDFITKPINWAILRHHLRYMWRASMVSNKLRKSESKNRALVNAIPDLLLQIGSDGTILEFSAPNGFNWFIAPERMLTQKIADIFPDDVAGPLTKHLERALTSGEIQFFEHKLECDSRVYYFEWRIVNNGKNETLAIVRDITERKLSEQRIIHLAYHDTLTGLLNRHSFKEHVAHAVAQAQRHNRFVAVLFLDLDRFKRINDTLGYEVGDLLLQKVSERILECVRKSDRAARHESESESCISRLGGDEFTLLLPEIAQISDAAKVAKRILDTISQQFMIGGHEIFVSGSIGITVYPLDGPDPDTLLKNADSAMYSAKEQGRNNFQFYSKSMNATSFKRLTLETSLRKALDREEFLVYYQPQVEIRSGEIAGMEALIRWKSPEMGMVSPADFIPLAEECGLIVPIGEWVLITACKWNKSIQEMGFPPKHVSVNISSHQFRRQSLLRTITRALRLSGLPPEFLELELTESAIMRNMEESSRILQDLKAMGLRVAIDDFGTGYSSLAYLKRFPLDVLKIDRSFIRDIPSDQDNSAIATAIIAMAHSLNLKVVAEGVETTEQLSFLHGQGCDEVQGFFYSPPLSETDFIELLKNDTAVNALSANHPGS